ncbi:molybdenum cofactor biosynthesis protein MoaE, partial [Clostridioides difficile]|nr:molybdenum cofactor biosynthesis protein MoaE [Clostridioides difficile]
MHAKISDKPLNVAKVVSLVSDDRSGAVVTFTGVVRNHVGGQSVTALDYSAHPHATPILANLVQPC